MNKVQIKHLRVMLFVTWVAMSGLLLLLGSCAAERWEDEPDVRPIPGVKYPVTFAALTVAGEVETRASTPMASGTLRLLVYVDGESPLSAPVANCTYTVTDGELKQTSGEEALSLYAGTYQFYALSPSSIEPKGGIASGFTPGADPLASLTTVNVLAAGATVTLNALSHKASKVSFILSKAADATFTKMVAPSLLTLSDQAVSPATFTLGAGGGSLSAAAGTGTVELTQFTETPAGSGIYRAEQLLLPKPSGNFKIRIQTQLTVLGVVGDYNLGATISATAFEPGTHYSYTISVKNPSEMVQVDLAVTPWTEYTWEDVPY